ncbi:hypothetical protein H9P43_001432 [Blastocladiella emersonii ATCC 22665]|nr:hypothetical protein H9P43_001432 [Blastocladiella emersonii ATCC 22665]
MQPPLDLDAGEAHHPDARAAPRLAPIQARTRTPRMASPSPSRRPPTVPSSPARPDPALGVGSDRPAFFFTVVVDAKPLSAPSSPTYTSAWRSRVTLLHRTRAVAVLVAVLAASAGLTLAGVCTMVLANRGLVVNGDIPLNGAPPTIPLLLASGLLAALAGIGAGSSAMQYCRGRMLATGLLPIALALVSLSLALFVTGPVIAWPDSLTRADRIAGIAADWDAATAAKAAFDLQCPSTQGPRVVAAALAASAVPRTIAPPTAGVDGPVPAVPEFLHGTTTSGAMDAPCLAVLAASMQTNLRAVCALVWLLWSLAAVALATWTSWWFLSRGGRASSSPAKAGVASAA